MGELFHLRWPLNDLDSKYGWNSSLSKAIVPSLTVLYQRDDEVLMSPVRNIEKALHDIVMIGGIGSLVTPIFVSFMPSPVSLYMEGIVSFRALLTDDLLEINDKFFDFIGEEGGFYFQFFG